MRHIKLNLSEEFRVIAGTSRSQAAVMVLAAGEATGGPDNTHPGSDQWLYVIDGNGEATVGEDVVRLEPGSLLLIETGEAHEIRAGSDGSLRALNIYAPPEY
jgi:mannose-6-phosphate isomerase-like protein (cupin superfamily)